MSCSARRRVSDHAPRARQPRSAAATTTHVGSADDPLFARDKACGPHGKLAQLKALDQRLRLVVPDEHMARVEGRENPRLVRVDVYALDPLRRRGEFPLCAARRGATSARSTAPPALRPGLRAPTLISKRSGCSTQRVSCGRHGARRAPLQRVRIQVWRGAASSDGDATLAALRSYDGRYAYHGAMIMD
jgi:hypothetical protein